jgi:hypothetical protein
MTRATRIAGAVWPFACLAAVALAVIVTTFRDYGVSYDDEWRSGYGEAIVAWYTSGFRDDRAVHVPALNDQGGFPFVVAHLASTISPAGRFETGHLVYALFGLLAVGGAYGIGLVLGGRPVGVLSAVLLAVTPRFYGHSFVNAVDIPFAALHTLTILGTLRLLGRWPRVPLSLLAGIGAVIGLALATRVAGVVLLAYVGLALGLLLWDSARGAHAAALRQMTAQAVRALLIVGSCAYLVMLIWWPAALLRPLYRPARALWFAVHGLGEVAGFTMLFEGRQVSTLEVPWYFVWKWFLLTLPEHYLLLAAAGAWLLARRWRTERRPPLADERVRRLQWTVVIAACLVPLALAVGRSVEYDEVRHYLFLVPLFAVMGGTALAASLAAARASHPRLASIVVAGVAASAALSVVDMVRLHPLQYIYFNRLVAGGMQTAARSYETDYWGLGYKEAVEWIVQHRAGPKRLTVASCLFSTSTAYYLPERAFEFLGSFHDGTRVPPGAVPDLFLASPRWACDARLGGCVIHTVSRVGAPLLWVKDVRLREPCGEATP